jgi:hypothetical protein
MTTSKASTTPVTPIMRMGCTNVTLTYRAAGEETICLQSPSHGVQQLAGFDAAKGDVIGLDDILETTLAHDNLSDVANYITSVVANGSTTLYFDPTGHGLQGTPFAVLQGVQTTVAQLVADGGMKYIPDRVTLTPTYSTPFTLRPDGLETVNLLAPQPGIGAQQINGFDPTKGDVLELRSILNPTTAAPDLSNVANYITATTVGGNTILSVDRTGTGQAGVAFAELTGVSVTVAQLVADNALSFTPSSVTVAAPAGQVFQFRSEGNETANLSGNPMHSGYTTLMDFSLTASDRIGVGNLFAASHIDPATANLAHYISAVQNAGSTSLWFDQSGSGHGGGVEFAMLQNTTTTVASLIAHGAFSST